MNAAKQLKPLPTTKREARIIYLNQFNGPHDPGLNQLLNGLWQAAHSALWPEEDFSQKEQKEFKKLLSVYFQNSKAPSKTFKELIERICLAKRSMGRNGCFLCEPISWLNMHFPLGLFRTAAWYNQIKKIRKKVPTYNSGMRLLAEGIYAFIKKPDTATFKKYEKKLRSLKQFDLLPVYHHVVLIFFTQKRNAT